MRRVFIANRGEIALRIVRACRTLGLECVVGASDVDRDGEAARLADRVVVLGQGPARDSYLRTDTVVAAALGTGCDALHPGYGFLAESATLAARVREHGLVFVGPPTEAIVLSGDKLRARTAAQAAGVPVLPGTEVQTAADAQDAAQRIGFPLLVKAAGGGGGRGIKLARDRDALAALVSLARSEAGSAFADDRVYLERLIESARHVEIQIAADEHGAVVHLGERDCSVQRRYQKVVEESPAPALADVTRAALARAAVSFARAIGYVNLGTVEFVVDAATKEFFFLECNCRIQVEHPVTEMVSGRDLVALQLRIAAGEPLGFGQDDIALSGHAVECRLTAEDPDRGHLPTPGTLSRFTIRARPGLRVDTHCRPGTVVPPYYDSLLAKLIVHGEDRRQAIDGMLGALRDVDVAGVHTNRALLMDVLDHPQFRAGAVTTGWLESVL